MPSKRQIKSSKKRYWRELPVRLQALVLTSSAQITPAARRNFWKHTPVDKLASIVPVRCIYWEISLQAHFMFPGPDGDPFAHPRAPQEAKHLHNQDLSLGHLFSLWGTYMCYPSAFSEIFSPGPMLSQWQVILYISVHVDSWETSSRPTHHGLDPCIIQLSVTVTKSGIIDFKRGNMYFGSVWKVWSTVGFFWTHSKNSTS